VHFGKVINPEDIEARQKAARYLIRSPISLEKMTYKAADGKVLYGNPTGKKQEFDAMDFLALVASHIPNRYSNRVLYYGWYSKKSRGCRKKKAKEQELSTQEPTVVEPTVSNKAVKRRWVSLIRKIWQTDPLSCPKCFGRMKIISFIP